MQRFFLFLAVGWITHVSAARAITMVPRDFDQLVARADTIFEGTVTSATARWTGTGETRHIATFVSFDVARTFKGGAVTEQTLEFAGGMVDSHTTTIDDIPIFQVGQRAILFVVGNNRQLCPLVGVNQGRFHVQTDSAAGAERVYSDNLAPLTRTVEIGQLDPVTDKLPERHLAARNMGSDAMTAEDFRKEITDKVRSLTP